MSTLDNKDLEDIFQALAQNHQWSKELEDLKNDYDFVDRALEMIEKNSKIFDMLKKSTKCDVQAVMYRKEGNNLFQEKNLLESLKSYTKSISFATDGSQNLALAYGNRSAVLFDKRYYKECLEDIERALKNNYPGDKREKLIVRQKKAQCQLAQARKFTYHEMVPTIRSRNDKIPVAADSVKIEKNDTFNRYVVSTRDIKKGEIISVEKPFVQTTLQSAKYLHCSECLELCYNLIPCEICSGVMYCSLKCRDNAFISYHRYECLLMTHCCEFQELFVRMILKGIREYIVDLEGNQENVTYGAGSYKEICSLVTNKEKRPLDNLFKQACQPAMFYRFLKNNTDILLEFRDIKDGENVLKELLFRHNLAVDTNIKVIQKLSKDDESFTKVGTAIYPFYSLFNHSCDANVCDKAYGSTLVILAEKNIKKGEQCFLNYGYMYIYMEKPIRTAKLRTKYCFECKCPACVNNWPTRNYLPYDDTTMVSRQLMSKLKMLKRELLREDKHNKNVFNKLLGECFHITDHWETKKVRVPTRFLVYVEELICECYTLLGNKDLRF